MLRVQKIRLYPNETMKQVLDDLCDYRRYCWNQGLALWNDMYDASLVLGDKKLRPSARKVRDELVANKEDWQYQLSARCLQLTISDLGKAWQNFFKKSLPDWGKPKFKSKKTAKVLKQTELRLLTVSYGWISRTGLKLGLILVLKVLMI